MNKRKITTRFKGLQLVIVFILGSSSVFSQFRYTAWNLGLQTGVYIITNGMTNYALTGANYTPVLIDSVDCKFSITNFRLNGEVLKPKVYVKAAFSFPLKKSPERDSISVVGKHFEMDLKFAYGFVVKEIVGFQFGVMGGIFSLLQEKSGKVPGINRIDYFNLPSSGASDGGQKFFGTMGAYQGGLLVNNFIAFSDKMALRTSFSHSNLKNKGRNIDGRNNQLDLGLYYTNPEKSNLGFHVSFVQNWISLKGIGPVASENIIENERAFPATKVRMSTFYIGVNIPINFGD